LLDYTKYSFLLSGFWLIHLGFGWHRVVIKIIKKKKELIAMLECGSLLGDLIGLV